MKPVKTMIASAALAAAMAGFGGGVLAQTAGNAPNQQSMGADGMSGPGGMMGMRGPGMMGQGGMGQQGMPGQGGMMAPGGQGGMMMGPGMMGQGGMMGRGMMGMMGMGPGMMMGHACDAMAGNVERGLANAKYELKITEAQEPAWQAYANAEREAAKMMTARCTAMANEGGAMLPLPDRLDRHEQALAVRLDNLRSVNKALKALYGELSETQKSQANNLLNPLGLAMGTM